MSEFIRAEDVTFFYEEEDTYPAVREVSFLIERGEYVAILGHNGSGKSTLAKLMNGILLPTAGRLTVDGVEMNDGLTDDDVFSVRRKVGMVFQNPDNQLVATVVEEDVAFGPENLGIPPAEIRERVAEALKEVGMTDYRKHAPSHLSGGQKQRVALAGVIAMRPTCIIFDESTAMLDPLGRKDITRCMERLNKTLGITVLHITHYMEEAAEADRILVMNDGELILDGTPAAVFSEVEKMNDIGLSVPQGTELLYRLAKEGYDLPSGVTAVDGCVTVLSRLLREKGVQTNGK